MNISQEIRKRRLALNMTQEQVATRLGVSAPAVNKWERGASYPDITLIPALARLLNTDANTLLSFEEGLSPEKNLAIQREVERRVREEGYDAGFSYAREQLRAYPSSDELAITLASYLDGALMLYQVPDLERYRPQIEAEYERLASSSVNAVRDQALTMLVAKAMAQEDCRRAQTLLDRIPEPTIDKQEQQAALYMKQGDYERAERLWETRVTKSAGALIAALSNLSEIALRQGSLDEARDIARRAEPIARACDLPRWMSATLELGAEVAQHDAEATMRLLEEIAASMKHMHVDDIDSPLHRYVGLTGISQLSQQMLALILAEVQTDDAYAFLRQDPALNERMRALINSMQPQDSHPTSI